MPNNSTKKTSQQPKRKLAADDSGAVALTGFLYQLLGSASLLCTIGVDTSTRREVSIQLEVEGQDAVATGKIRKLLQFKYSAIAKPLAKAELKKIAKNLKHSGKGGIPPTEYILYTNRELNADAERELKNAQSSGKNSDLTDLQVKGLRYSAIYRNLSMRAGKFGVLPHEIKGALAKAAGEMMMRIDQDIRVVTLEDLDSWLTGIPNARLIGAHAFNDYLQGELADQKEDLNIPNALVERDIAAEISSVDHGIVVVHGNGGMGKTTEVHSFLTQIIKRPAPTPFVQFCRASEGIPAIQEMICRWRRNATLAMESEATSIQRLIVSRPSLAPPQFYLAIDGVDEIDPRATGKLQQIFTFFRKEEKERLSAGRPPNAVLLITCRDKEELLQSYLLKSGYELNSDKFFCSVAVDKLSDRELERVTTVPGIDKVVADSILQYASQRVSGPAGRFAPLAPSIPAAGTPNQNVLEALRFPIFLKFFVSLGASEQRKALGGDSYELANVCSQIIKWFANKASLRLGIHRFKIAEQLLRSIAKTCPSGKVEYLQHWAMPSKAAGLSDLDANRFWREAESASLISFDSDQKWYWSMPFVHDYLTR